MVRLKAGMVIGVAALAATISTPVRAQAFNGGQLLQAVGLADLQQFALQHGDSIVSTGQEGVVSVLAKTKAGLNYSLIGAVCNQPGVTGCQAIFMQIKYNTTAAVTDATLSQANTRYAALKIFRDNGNTIVGIARYVILKGGITRQNVVDNVDILLGIAPAAAQIAFGVPPRAPQPQAPQRPQGQ